MVQDIVARLTGQSARLPGSLREAIETRWNGDAIQDWAFADLDEHMQPAETWIVLGERSVAVASRAATPPGRSGHRASPAPGGASAVLASERPRGEQALAAIAYGPVMGIVAARSDVQLGSYSGAMVSSGISAAGTQPKAEEAQVRPSSRRDPDQWKIVSFERSRLYEISESIHKGCSTMAFCAEYSQPLLACVRFTKAFRRAVDRIASKALQLPPDPATYIQPAAVRRTVVMWQIAAYASVRF